MRRFPTLVVGCAILAACGVGGTPSGPPEHVPTAGTAGYRKILGTYVIVDSSADLTDPTVLAESTDGPFQLWFTYNGREIRRSNLARLVADATPPAPALAPAEPWEGDRVAAPSVTRLPGGELRMAYEAADGVIGMATSRDGVSWTARTRIRPGRAPALLGERLFFEQDGWIWLGDTRLVRGAAPDVTVRTVSGRQVWHLFFNCPGRGGSVAICHAASFDGASFDTTYIPVLQPDLPDEQGPTAVLGTDRAVLFFAQQPSGLRVRIAAAIAP